MKRINVPTTDMKEYAGKWVAIDPTTDRIIAVGETLTDIESVITRPISDKRPSGTVPAAFRVPRADEGPYILVIA